MLSMFRRTPQLIIAPLEAERGPGVAPASTECFAHPWSASEIENMAASSGSVAHGRDRPRSGRILGFIISRKVIDEAEVLTIAVDSDCRKLGVGRRFWRPISGLGHGACPPACFLRWRKAIAPPESCMRSLGSRRQAVGTAITERQAAAEPLRLSCGRTSSEAQPIVVARGTVLTGPEKAY